MRETTDTGRYIGTMSGTSLDGLDVVLTAFSPSGLVVEASQTYPYPAQLAAELLALCSPGDNEITRLLAADIQLARFTAQSIQKLLQQHGLSPQDIIAIGHHGQTIRHLPVGDHPNTLQIGDANSIAHLCGITTVADFRRRDMAAGGQGAPLVPAFHRAVFHHADENRVIVNIGGVANITVLNADQGEVIGFDSGPGNVLMDLWYRQHQSGAIDEDGRWADTGLVNSELLDDMLSDPYFSQAHPKSTGREYFHQEWLVRMLAQRDLSAADVQASLCQLTAETILLAIGQAGTDCQRILVCGGGVHNLSLMRRLQTLAGSIPVESSANYGIHPDWVEGACFAWLAKQTIEGRPANLPSVTGASAEVILGAIYQA